MRQRLKNSSLTEKRVLWEHNHTAWLIHKYCVYEDLCSSKDRTYWSPWQQGAIDFHGNRWCSSGCISCNKMTPREACRPPISIFCFVIGRRKINLNGLTFVFWNKWTYFDMAINQAVWLKSLPETDCWIPWRLMLESLPVTRSEQKQTDWSPS